MLVQFPAASPLAACLHLYKKHDELLLNLSNVALNSILLASKIFEKMPAIFPRSALVILNYSGILFLNAQAKSWIKSSRDWRLALRLQDSQGIVLTASKVSVKGLNIILTCSMFAASIIALSGFPATTLAMYAVMRPFALGGWVLSIANEVSDYRQNQQVLKELESVRKSPNATVRVHQFVVQYFHLIRPFKIKPEDNLAERKLAMRTIRQMGDYSIQHYQEIAGKLASAPKPLNDQNEAWKHFLDIEGNLKKQVIVTNANLGLIALGYAALGICRLYPDSIQQWSVMWGMSVLYCSKHIYEKYIKIAPQEKKG